MFTITTHQDQYLTYQLQDQATASCLEVVPERGGIITRWQVQGRDLLYLDQARFRDPSLSVRGGIPILFPICGNLPGDRYRLEEQSYSLKQHGFARDLPWEVIQQDTQDNASVTLRLQSNEQTLAQYPFAFEVCFRYQIQGNKLRIEQQFTNHSPAIMPFSTGLHPYFAVSDKNQLRFDIPATMYQDQKLLTVLPFSDRFDFSQPEIDAIFKSVKRHTASVTDPTQDLTLTLHYSDHYSTLVFWTLQDQGFVCLEPWTAPRNALNTGEKLLLLDPQESLQTVVELVATFS